MCHLHVLCLGISKCGLNQRHMLASMNYKKDGKREPIKVKYLIQISYLSVIQILSSQIHIFLSLKMKQPPNFPTRVLRISNLFFFKSATSSLSLLHCFTYIGQIFRGSALEITVCVASQGSATLFQRLIEGYRNSMKEHNRFRYPRLGLFHNLYLLVYLRFPDLLV